MSSSELLAAVKDAEGLRLVAYRDTRGFWTVGYGHKLATGKQWDGYAISQDTASALLTLDLNEALMSAVRLPEWTQLDTQCRKDAVTELVYNMGAGKWVTFIKTRAAIKEQDWPCAAEGLLASLWATQVGKTRSGRLSRWIETGEY